MEKARIDGLVEIFWFRFCFPLTFFLTPLLDFRFRFFEQVSPNAIRFYPFSRGERCNVIYRILGQRVSNVLPLLARGGRLWLFRVRVIHKSGDRSPICPTRLVKYL